MATDVPSHGAPEQAASPSMQGAAAPRAPEVPPTASRLVSLDAFRGFIMFWIVGGGGLMAGLQSLGHNWLSDAVVYQLHHTPWEGLRFYDTIWPAFMLMVGISIPFAFAKRALTQTSRQITAHAFKRAVVLFLLGSLRESVLLKTPYLIELSSALQPIAIAYLIGAMVAKRSIRFLALMGGLILLGYALLLAFVSAPGIPAGTYELNHNLVHSVDIALLGLTHWNQWPYASEGWGTVLSTIPTVATTLLGLIIGKLLMMPTLSAKRKAGMIGMVGSSCFLAGWALSPIIPVIMKLWTTSYGLASAGVACLEFLIFFWIIEVRGYRKWAMTFVVFGSNAIFIYMFANLIPLQEWVSIFTQGLGSFWPRAVPLLTSILVLGVEGLILFWMHKRRIFIKA